MNLERSRVNPVKNYFEQKLKETGEEGEALERYTIGADLGFVRDHWWSKKRVVVFEVNGQNSGLTIPSNKLDDESEYHKRLFREIRATDRERWEAAIPFVNFYTVISNYLHNKDETRAQLAGRPKFKKILDPLFSLIDENDPILRDLLTEFTRMAETKNEVSLAKRLDTYIEKLQTNPAYEKYQCFTDLLKIVAEEMKHSTQPILKYAYHNSWEADRILSDKILQQEIIPEENKIPTYSGSDKKPKHGLWAVKDKDAARGEGFQKMHHRDAVAEVDENRRFTQYFLIQELLKTAGADNASAAERRNHSAMRLLADISIRMGKDGKPFAVIESGFSTHNVYPKTNDTRPLVEKVTRPLPSWSKFEPKDGARPVEASQEELQTGVEVIKKIALNLFNKVEGPVVGSEMSKS